MPLTQHGDRLAHDPPVDGRHEAMALRLRQERVGGLNPPTLVGQAQENLAPRTCRNLRCQGHDRLSVQLKLALIDRSGEAHDPSGLDLLLDPGGRLRPRELDAVASPVLGGIAGLVGGAQHVSRASALRRDGDDADADAQREAPLPQPYRKSSIARLSFPAVSSPLVSEQYPHRTPDSSPPRRASGAPLPHRPPSNPPILRGM